MPVDPLPIDEVLEDIVEATSRHGCAVVVAAPGAGKTTRVPPALLDALPDSDQRLVVCLEPRRVAARAAAARVARQRGTKLGGDVGYRVRYDDRSSSKTRLLFVTTGIFLRMLQADPFLDGIATVIFDELHERSLDLDLTLAMTRQVRRDVREDLQIVAMSATLVAGPLASWLGDCPVVESQGRSFPVDVRYLKRAVDDRFVEAVATVRREVRHAAGHLLVFVPGWQQIHEMTEALRRGQPEHEVHGLHGSLSLDQQARVLQPSARQKVIIATNVAESSLTIEGVTVVIDTGLHRQMIVDPSTGLRRLETTTISLQSADQRAGRAGRTQGGVCHRLWTRVQERGMPEVTVPEVAIGDLTDAVLQLAAWGESDPACFGWYEAPSTESLARAGELLRHLEAVTSTGLTPRGRTMADLPLEPRLAALAVVMAELGHPKMGARLAALLAERDPWRRDRDPPHLAERLELIATARGDSRLGLVATAVERASRRIERGLATVPSPGPASCDRGEALGRGLVSAFFDRVSQVTHRDQAEIRATMVGGRGLVGRPTVVSARVGELIAALDVADSRRAGARIGLLRMAEDLDAEWLPRRSLVEASEVYFDDEALAVRGRRVVRYLDLVLSEHDEAPDPDTAAGLLLERASERMHEALALEEGRVDSLLTRLDFVARQAPELGLPRVDDALLQRVLTALCPGRKSFAELRRAPIFDVLRAEIGYDAVRRLDELAPRHIEVPSGSQIRLQWRRDEPPILAVRIQEMYGCKQTPRVVGGRVPVLLHLLAPNMRPQQVTHDLASFWADAYHEVRKELRRRYAKHYWPDDPANATASSKPGRRGRPSSER